MYQPFMPGANHAQLLSAQVWGHAGDWMDFVLGLPASGPRRNGSINSSFDPHVGLAAAPVREDTHAVTCAEDVIEPVLYLVEANAEVDALRHLIRWFNIQGQMGHDAESTQRDHRAEKCVSTEIPL